MGWIDRWNLVLGLVVCYIAVATLVRLMVRRRDQDIAEVQQQLETWHSQQAARRPRGKKRDAA